MATYQLAVGETKDVAGKRTRVEAGKVSIFVPSLADMGWAVSPVKEENGLPVYGDEKAQMVFDGLFASVCAMNRNRVAVQEGKVVVTDPRGLTTDVASLFLAAEGSKGEHFVIRREYGEAVAKYLAGSGKSAKAVAVLSVLMTDKKAALVANEANKAAALSHIERLAESLPAEAVTRFAKLIEEMGAALAPSSDEDDLS